jgi:hypothetical protein
MSEIMECSQCHAPTAKRCSRCKLLLICSRECMERVWKTHKPDCKAIQRGRAASLNGGANPETIASIPLVLPAEQVATLFAPCEAVRTRYAETEQRLICNDKSLGTAEKVRFYSDLLQALDTSGNEYDDRTLVHKMALNSRYNAVYRDATARLQPAELAQLNREMKRRRIGAFFKQHG